MEITVATENQWTPIKEIYLEAFPKRESKPYFALRHSVKKKKALVMTAAEGNQLLGFTVLIPYRDMVMVDYLAVSSKIRSKGTGSHLLEHICKHFAGKKIVLLIERPDDAAENQSQRLARRRFYFKNGFTSSNLFITGVSGEMEIMNCGGMISADDYMALQQYALGSLFFKLSKIRIIDKSCK